MIYGIGTDILQISRMQAAYDRTQGRIAHKVLGEEELVKFQHRLSKSPARGMRFLATRFAAKEAFSKAIGLGMRTPMTWRAMQTLNDASGRPVVVTQGPLAQWMRMKNLAAHVTLTDEVDYAVAFVVVELIPDESETSR